MLLNILEMLAFRMPSAVYFTDYDRFFWFVICKASDSVVRSLASISRQAMIAEATNND